MTFVQKWVSQSSEKIWKIELNIVACFVMIEEFNH